MATSESRTRGGMLPEHADHSRLFQANRYVYPVLSRRSRGISVGINLNPDKICNFDCVYCQVDRRSDAETTFVDSDRLRAEIEATLDVVSSGRLHEDPRFQHVPDRLRRLNDIAFSGDGEPTSFRNFPEIVAEVAAIKRAHGLDDVKLVLITNASLFHRPRVREGLATLDANQGEIWAKLDAGTEAYFTRVERTTIPFQRILDNLLEASRVRPLVIQSLFLRLAGNAPSASEIDAYVERLLHLVRHGGALARIQVYTVARQPAEATVTPLSSEELAGIAARVREGLSVPVEEFPGSAEPAPADDRA